MICDFLGGPVIKNPPANAENTGSIPTLGRFHILQGNWARARKPMSHNYWSPAFSRACTLQQEKPSQREARTPLLECSPRLPLLEKAHTTAKIQNSQK